MSGRRRRRLATLVAITMLAGLAGCGRESITAGTEGRPATSRPCAEQVVPPEPPESGRTGAPAAAVPTVSTSDPDHGAEHWTPCDTTATRSGPEATDRPPTTDTAPTTTVPSRRPVGMPLVWIDTATGTWWEQGSAGPTERLRGAPGDTPVPADYDGDGHIDLAVVRGDEWLIETDPPRSVHLPPPSMANDPMSTTGPQAVPGAYFAPERAAPAWYDDRSATWTFDGHAPVVFGTGRATEDDTYQDMPVPADYDGDGRTDLAVYNPRSGRWRVRQSKDGQEVTHQVGGRGAFPAPADYDGDGRAEPAAYTFDNQWLREDGATEQLQPVQASPPASPTFPVPADHDGDGRAELAVVTDLTSSHQRWQLRGREPMDMGGSSRSLVPVTLPQPLLINGLRLTFIFRCSRPQEPSMSVKC